MPWFGGGPLEKGWCEPVPRWRPILQRAKSESVVTGGELRSASQGEGHTARISTTDDGRTHPLAERLKEDAFPYSERRSRSGYPRGKGGTNEVSSRRWVRHLQYARDVSW